MRFDSLSYLHFRKEIVKHLRLNLCWWLGAVSVSNELIDKPSITRALCTRLFAIQQGISFFPRLLIEASPDYERHTYTESEFIHLQEAAKAISLLSHSLVNFG